MSSALFERRGGQSAHRDDHAVRRGGRRAPPLRRLLCNERYAVGRKNILLRSQSFYSFRSSSYEELSILASVSSPSLSSFCCGLGCCKALSRTPTHTPQLEPQCTYPSTMCKDTDAREIFRSKASEKRSGNGKPPSRQQRHQARSHSLHSRYIPSSNLSLHICTSREVCIDSHTERAETYLFISLWVSSTDTYMSMCTYACLSVYGTVCIPLFVYGPFCESLRRHRKPLLLVLDSLV